MFFPFFFFLFFLFFSLFFSFFFFPPFFPWKEGPFWEVGKEGKVGPLGCSSLAEGTWGQLISQGFSCDTLAACGSTQCDGEHSMKHAAFVTSGSTPRGSCMFDTLGPVTSNFKMETVRFAGKTNLHSSTKVSGCFSKVSTFSWQEHDTRPVVLSRFRSGHSSQRVDSFVRGALVAHQPSCFSHSVSSHNFDLVRDLSSCHRAPLLALASAPLPSPVSVGRGGRVARWAGRVSALCCPCCGLDLVGGNDNICGGVFVECTWGWPIEFVCGTRSGARRRNKDHEYEYCGRGWVSHRR